MLRINNIKMSISHNIQELKEKAAEILDVNVKEIEEFKQFQRFKLFQENK